MRAEQMVGNARVGRVGERWRCEGRLWSRAEGVRGKGRKGKTIVGQGWEGRIG